MKIIRPTEVTVEFENVQEAARFLYAYTAGEGLPALGFPILSQRGAEADRLAAGRAAVVKLAEGLGVTISHPAGVTSAEKAYAAGRADGKIVDPQHAAPTYCSGSSDRVYLISKMPTQYIRNVLAMDAYRQTVGLNAALKAGLRRRGERA